MAGHKGKRILYLDYSKLSPEQITEMIEEVKKLMVQEPHGSIPGLGNFEEVHFSTRIINEFNSMDAATNNI